MTIRKARPTGGVIYRGPSLLDGSPIVVVAVSRSGNRKTGDMVQTYILRSDMDPREASRTGADFAICGTCPLRGIPTDRAGGIAAFRGRYVQIGQGPLGVYRALGRGRYPDVADASALGVGRMVRLGTYGDPSAVPGYVWDALLSGAKGWTGYSHQRHTPGADFRPDRCMVSADSIDGARSAWAEGFRTFRVIGDVADLAPEEVLCPASEEAGRKATCETCRLCSGTSKAAKSVAIVAHGSGARNVPALQSSTI